MPAANSRMKAANRPSAQLNDSVVPLRRRKYTSVTGIMK